MLKFFAKKHEKLEYSLFRVCFHIGRGANTEMPVEWLGAYVTLFASDIDHQVALAKMGNKLIGNGYEIKGVEGKIDQLDPFEWDSFIKTAWFDFPDFFPSQEEIIERIRHNDLMLFSPFAGYDNVSPNKGQQH